jgi:hypothetical protein
VIDKSLTEIAAVKELVGTGDAKDWLLCYFHLLQDWERFLRSAESGIPHGRKAERHTVMVSLAALAHVREKTVFESQVGMPAGREGWQCS